MRKLATSSLSFATAILLSHYLLPYKLLLFISAAAVAASFIGLFFHGHLRLRLFIVFLSLSVGFFWSWAHSSLMAAPADHLQSETFAVKAVVKSYPSTSGRGYRIDGVVFPENSRKISARLYYNKELDIAPGDIIEFQAKFLRTESSDRSERIDALSSRGAFVVGYVSGDISVVGSKGAFLYFPQRVAQSFSNMIDRIFPDDISHFMKALLVGQRDELSHDAAVTAALSSSGISHVVSISGMHVSFLMGFLAALIKNKRLFAIYGIPILLMFMAMTGFTPSVTRAGIMQISIICAPLMKRESDSLTSISAALFILLAINPNSIASIGLQLSFSATLGIIIFSGRIDAAVTDGLHESKRHWHKPLKKAVSFVVTGLSTTIGALIFTTPLTAVHFGFVSIIAPITNLLTIWAISLAFPIGIIACLLGFFIFPLGSAIAYPAAIATRYVIFVARSMSSVPYATLYSSNAYVLFWLAYVYVMFIMLPILRARVRQYIMPFCACIVTLCIVLLVSPYVTGNNGSSLTVLDVGQGLSVVIRSDNKTAVIDTGSSSGENAGFITHEHLTNNGITSIDLLALTHFHADHINGVEFLLTSMHVSSLVIPDPEGAYLAKDIIELARKRGTDIIYVTETYRAYLGELELVLYPPLGFGDENERGLAILCLGSISALITGDMNASSERSLLRFADLPVVDAIVVGHHGSRFSASDELLTTLVPKTAIISVGRNNYGHPAVETLERLDRHGCTIYRTDHMGHITIRG